MSNDEDKKRRRSKMRKYVKVAKEQNQGYNAMLSLNGAETLGEQNRVMIDQYLGIASTEAGSAERGEVKTPDLAGVSSLRQLQ